MSWNYRVMKHTDEKFGEDYFQIHEVYYDETGKHHSYTEGAVTVGADDLAGVGNVLKMMAEALTKPVLTTKDFEK